jgi:hypothetical protein
MLPLFQLSLLLFNIDCTAKSRFPAYWRLFPASFMEPGLAGSISEQVPKAEMLLCNP